MWQRQQTLYLLIAAILPLGVGVFCFLAARGCFQDQLMVESAMRIRERRKRNK